jgi:flagellum-specific ATP synthase
LSILSVLPTINNVPETRQYVRVASVQGLLVEVVGALNTLGIGTLVSIECADERLVPCEVVGFRDDRALLMPFGTLDGVRMGCRALVGSHRPAIYPCEAWLGRVVNAFGQPIDGKGPLDTGLNPMTYRASPPPAHTRGRVGGKLDLGVRALNSFLTCCQGQRMGIFAGSGVGKSVLLSMLARYTSSDISVIGLIGERGREVQEFIEDDLGEEGLKRSVVVVATSDESALMRRQAAYLTLSLSEYFRDLGSEVLCLIDSVTRFAMAQREIGLSCGEPPTTKGYTPTVFSELPRLLERAGPGTAGSGSITGLFTVLVDGDDHNEPIADAVRGILDGHIVMDRAIAERGRFPAINILKSVSRTMPSCNTPEEQGLVTAARQQLSVYEDMAELIRLGAYRKGTDAAVDQAIHYYPQIEAFLNQGIQERTGLEEGYQMLAEILGNSAEPDDLEAIGQGSS